MLLRPNPHNPTDKKIRNRFSAWSSILKLYLRLRQKLVTIPTNTLIPLATMYCCSAISTNKV